jgi:hypothetical protein
LHGVRISETITILTVTSAEMTGGEELMDVTSNATGHSHQAQEIAVLEGTHFHPLQAEHMPLAEIDHHVEVLVEVKLQLKQYKLTQALLV